MPSHPREHFDALERGPIVGVTAGRRPVYTRDPARYAADLTEMDWFYVHAEPGGWRVEGYGPWTGKPDILLRVEDAKDAESVAQRLAALLNGDRYEIDLTQPWWPLPLYRAVITDRELRTSLSRECTRRTGLGYARMHLWASRRVEKLEAMDAEPIVYRLGARP